MHEPEYFFAYASVQIIIYMKEKKNYLKIELQLKKRYYMLFNQKMTFILPLSSSTMHNMPPKDPLK